MDLLQWPPRAISEIKRRYAVTDDDPPGALPGREAWLNSRLWTCRGTQADEITEGIWLGRMPRKAERNEQAIASIVDVTAELPLDTEGTVYRGVPMLDLVAPPVEALEATVEAIDELSSARPTLICCALGYSRSARCARCLADRKWKIVVRR